MRSDNYPNKSTETLLYSETDSRTLKYWDDFASKERLCYSTMYYWGTMPAQGETMLSSSCTMGDYACPGRNYALEFMYNGGLCLPREELCPRVHVLYTNIQRHFASEWCIGILNPKVVL